MPSRPQSTDPELHRGRKTQRGVSLVESMMVVAILVITLAAAAPGFHQAWIHRHLDGAAAQLETDLHYARSMAVTQRRNLRLTFFEDQHGSCYVVHGGSSTACTCSAQRGASCTDPGNLIRVQSFAADGPLRLRANVRSMVFDATKATVTPAATLRLVGATASEIQVVVNIMGRVRNCSTGAVEAVRGYRPC